MEHETHGSPPPGSSGCSARMCPVSMALPPRPSLWPLEGSLLPVHPSSLLGRGASLEVLSAAHSCLPAGTPHKVPCPPIRGSQAPSVSGLPPLSTTPAFFFSSSDPHYLPSTQTLTLLLVPFAAHSLTPPAPINPSCPVLQCWPVHLSTSMDFLRAALLKPQNGLGFYFPLYCLLIFPF